MTEEAIKKPIGPGSINIYTCQGKPGHQTVTVDRDDGTTPFMIDCQVDGCQEQAVSAFYRVDQQLTPSHEWYRPKTAGERKKLGKNTAAAEHVRMGGLLLRPIQS